MLLIPGNSHYIIISCLNGFAQLDYQIVFYIISNNSLIILAFIVVLSLQILEVVSRGYVVAVPLHHDRSASLVRFDSGRETRYQPLTEHRMIVILDT